jgi:hypothetical protein
VFLRDGVRAPLGLGDVLLEDASSVKGFIGEAYAVAGAPDITHHGGWRAYLAAATSAGEQPQPQQPGQQHAQAPS